MLSGPDLSVPASHMGMGWIREKPPGAGRELQSEECREAGPQLLKDSPLDFSEIGWPGDRQCGVGTGKSMTRPSYDQIPLVERIVSTEEKEFEGEVPLVNSGGR